MIADVSLFVTIGLAVIAGIVWLVRLEGLVKGHTQLFEERKSQVSDWLDAHEKRDDERHKELKGVLEEIKDGIKQGPRDAEAAQVMASAKVAAQNVVEAARVVATAVVAAAELAKPRTRKSPKR